MYTFDNFQMPFNSSNYFPSEQELQIAKAIGDAEALKMFGSNPNSMRQMPFNMATSMSMNPAMASGIPTVTGGLLGSVPLAPFVSPSVENNVGEMRQGSGTGGKLGQLPSNTGGLLGEVDVSADPAKLGFEDEQLLDALRRLAETGGLLGRQP